MNQIEIKMEIHNLIRQSDLVGLKNKYDKLQSSVLRFDDPSLILMAIEVYLDPNCLTNQDYQKDIIVFLIKIGLRLWAPNGNIILYLINKCGLFESQSNEDFDNLTNAQNQIELENKLIEVVDLLLEYKFTSILLSKLPDMNQNPYQILQNYLVRHKSALIIQTWWRKYWIRKQQQSKIQIQLSEESPVFTMESNPFI